MDQEPAPKRIKRESQKPEPAQPNEAEVSQLRQLVKVAGQERKNLQLLIEYLDQKSEEFDDKKLFLEKINRQIPDTLQILEALNGRVEEIKSMDTRVGEKLKEKTRLIKTADKNVNRLEYILD